MVPAVIMKGSCLKDVDKKTDPQVKNRQKRYLFVGITVNMSDIFVILVEAAGLTQFAATFGQALLTLRTEGTGNTRYWGAGNDDDRTSGRTRKRLVPPEGKITVVSSVPQADLVCFASQEKAKNQ